MRCPIGSNPMFRSTGALLWFASVTSQRYTHAVNRVPQTASSTEK